MSISFTQISEKLPYKPSLKSSLSTYHSDIITYISNNFDGTYNQKHRTIQLMNSISYRCLIGDAILNWNVSNPFEYFDEILLDESMIKPKLGNMYILERSVNWDIDIKEDKRIDVNKHIEPIEYPTVKPEIVSDINVPKISHKYTQKEDLYLQPPTIPQFDNRTVWMSGNIDG